MKGLGDWKKVAVDGSAEAAHEGMGKESERTPLVEERVPFPSYPGRGTLLLRPSMRREGQSLRGDRSRTGGTNRLLFDPTVPKDFSSPSTPRGPLHNRQKSEQENTETSKRTH